MVGFFLLGFDATLDNGCGIGEQLHSFREVICFQGHFKTLPISGWT